MTVPSGEGAGGPFILREWQRKFIRAIYEPHGLDGRRLVRRAILSVARKNGKTALIAALVLVHLVGPEAIQNGEIYSAANSRDQAAEVFKAARQFVEADPELSRLIRVVDSTKRLVCYHNGSVYRALSAEAGTKHGLNPSFGIFDELAQAKSRELYDVIDTAFGARAEPLFAVISTQSNDPQHILSQLIDDGLSGQDPRIVCHLYTVPEDADERQIFRDRKLWKLANPALGDFRSLEDMAGNADKARRVPSFEPAFRNLFLNQRVAPHSSLISRAEWMACRGVAVIPKGAKVYLALDLSSVLDLTALSIVSDAEPLRLQAHFWKPEELLEEHSKRDFGSGNRRYEEWRDLGWLNVSPGRSVNPLVVAKKIAELVGEYEVLGLAYDRWRIQDLLRYFDEIGLEAFEDKGDTTGSGLRLVPWGQGFRDMGPAIDALELAITERRLVHQDSPLLNWNFANAIALADPAGNRKIDKSKAKFRIDGAVAAAMAIGLRARDRAKADTTIVKGFLEV